MISNPSPTHRTLYRKWRPRKFEEVIGQPETIRILRNSVKKRENSHAYLFAGPRGTGKTSVARILAKAINCDNQSDGEPCNECPSCKRIINETALDVVEIDGASNRGIDEIRDLREEVNYVPAEIRNKVYIIDEVHMLTNEAFNALLKTLEEPPKNVVFIFATTEPYKIPTTIISRCQVFEFKRIPSQEIDARLNKVVSKENLKITEEARAILAEKAKGSMRDALVILEQMASFHGDEQITAADLRQVLGLTDSSYQHDYVRSILKGNSQPALEVITSLDERGKDFELFLEDCLNFLKDGIIHREDSKLFTALSRSKLTSFTREVLNLLDEVRFSSNKKITLEIGTLELIEQFGTEERSKRSQKKPSPQQSGEGKISEKWSSLIDEVSRERISIAAFLQEGKIKTNADRVIIEYDPDFSFHKESIEQADNFSYVQDIVRKYFGDSYKVEIKYTTDSKSENNNLALKTDLVKKRFQGTVIEEGRNYNK